MVDLDFADLKPSVLNWFLVGLMAMSFIVAVKFLIAKYPNPLTVFFRDFVNAV